MRRPPLSVNVESSEGAITAFDDLSPEVRVAKFRELALHAKRGAALTEGEQRKAFMASAGIWLRLANLAEQEIEMNRAFEAIKPACVPE